MRRGPMVATLQAMAGPAAAHQHQRDLSRQLVSCEARPTPAIRARDGEALSAGDRAVGAAGLKQGQC